MPNISIEFCTKWLCMNLAWHCPWENTSWYKILKPTQRNCKLVTSIATQAASVVLLHGNLYNTLHGKGAITPPIAIICLQLLHANETFAEYILHSIVALSFKFLLKTFHDPFHDFFVKSHSNLHWHVVTFHLGIMILSFSFACGLHSLLDFLWPSPDWLFERLVYVALTVLGQDNISFIPNAYTLY